MKPKFESPFEEAITQTYLLEDYLEKRGELQVKAGICYKCPIDNEVLDKESCDSPVFDTGCKWRPVCNTYWRENGKHPQDKDIHLSEKARQKGEMEREIK